MIKVKRNDPCPCGSGKKYKKCCLSKDETDRISKAKEPDDPVKDDETVLRPSEQWAGPRLPELPEEEYPLISEYDNLYGPFKAADFSGKQAILEKAILDPEPMHEDY